MTALLVLFAAIALVVVLLSSSGGSRAVDAKAQLVQVCEQARNQIFAVARAAPAQAAANPLNPQAIAFSQRVLLIENQSLGRAQAIVQSAHFAPALVNAFAIEARGQLLVAREIPALKEGSLARAKQYAAKARQLTLGADAEIRSAGLGACVGS